MRTALRTLLAACTLATLTPHDVAATKVRRLTLDQIRDQAASIALVRIDSSTTRADETGRMVWTDYAATVVNRLSGDVAGSVTLSFAGGIAGGLDTGVIGVPTLQIGSSYVMFLSDRSGVAMPTVGWGQGLFQLTRDGAGRELLVSGDGESLVVAADGTLVRGPLMQVRDGRALAATSTRSPLVQRAPAPTAFDSEGRPLDFPRERRVAAAESSRPATLADLASFVKGAAR